MIVRLYLSSTISTLVKQNQNCFVLSIVKEIPIEKDTIFYLYAT